MKLLACVKCNSVFNLSRKIKKCECGDVSGAYSDNLNAWYRGKSAIPIGFGNSTIQAAIILQPENGKGVAFNAFVIPKNCDTFINKTNP